MKAAVYEKYGTPDVIQIQEVSEPVPDANEVLVNVKAASINSWDYERLIGTQPRSGMFTPSNKMQGGDVAGIVTEVGEQVQDLNVGDEVYGDIAWYGFGTFAELVTGPSNMFAKKPSNMSFQEAAAIPQAGVLAWQGVNWRRELQPDQNVLINGGGGGVGTFAIQLAKYIGATVTAVDNKHKLDMMRSVGADRVIDYYKEDYTKGNDKYDLILDMINNKRVFSVRKVLNREGRHAIIGGKIGRLANSVLFGAFIGRMGDKMMGVVVHKPNRNDLEILSMLWTENKIKPVIDKEFTLDEVQDAFRYFSEQKFTGKIVINI